MTPIEQLLEHLADAFATAPPPVPGMAIEVTEVKVDLPVEAKIVAGGAVEMSLPRGMMATGFGWPHGRLRMRLEAL